MGNVINKAQYKELVSGARVLEYQWFGVKVWLTTDRRIIKMFRLKKPPDLGWLIPYNKRFARNSRRLLARGVLAPKALETFTCPEINRTGIIYEWLEGTPLYDLLPDATDETLFRSFARYLCFLHEKGVYFRSVHPGNILLRKDGSMGLIDIQDIRFWPWALGAKTRARNFRHLYNSDEHSLAMRDFGYQRFADLYLQEVSAGNRRRQQLRSLIMAGDLAWEDR